MSDKQIVLEYTDENPSFGRKDVLPIKSLMPLWFRGADLKIAQGVLRSARCVNKLIAKDLSIKDTELKNKFCYMFDNDSTRTISFNHDIVYNVVNENGFWFSIRYLAQRDDDLNLTGHVEQVHSHMPAEGLVAKLRDEFRLNKEFCDTPVSASTNVSHYIEAVIELINELGNDIVVFINPSFSGKSMLLSVMARNNHGRVLNITLSTENKDF